MRPIATVFFLLLLPLSSLASDPAPDVRSLRAGWYYAGGVLRKIGSDRWQEKGPAGTFTYKEVDRQPTYVELHDFDRKLSVRVFDTAAYAWRRNERVWYLVYTGQWDDPRKTPLDLARNASERDAFQTPRERSYFPRLGNAYEVLAAASERYNCISWSLEVTDRWIWPARPGLPITFGDFDDLYSRHGYRRLAALSLDRVPGQDKIVLYATVTAGNVLEP